MRYAYIEPSAWVKRYYRETGTALTNQLFDMLLRARPSRLLCSRAGMAEVVAVLNRHRNAGRVTQSLFNTAYAHFEEETRRVRLLPVRNHQIDASIRLLLVHNLNATDALHLRVALEVHSQLHRQGDTLLLFAADRRLLRAAQAEGLMIFNPEVGSSAQLESLLSCMS
jgi:predicted nucleic acid-binding protein